jgi:hypothetical protein
LIYSSLRLLDTAKKSYRDQIQLRLSILGKVSYSVGKEWFEGDWARVHPGVMCCDLFAGCLARKDGKR